MKQKNSYRRSILLLLLVLPCFVFAQSTLIGKVNSDKGETVPFANVIQKGTTNGTTTGIDGNFTIEVPSLPTTLEFSSLGYLTVELRVTNATPITVTMGESAQALEEVVVTGLATSVKRTNSANAVASISAEQLTGTTPPPTLDGALYGKFAGAVVNSNSGAPGGGISVKLRGATSLQGNIQPLYIIDGVYVDNSSIAAGLNTVSGAASGGSASNQDNPTNRIADLNPEDIANIEILKGASAAAIYGSRAAAGVIIITTKRGKAGETQFKFSQSVGWVEAINLLGVRDYTAARVEESFGAADAALFVAASNAGTLVDYEKEIFGEHGIVSNSNFSMAGGSDKTKFFAGISHNNEAGIVLNTGYEKTSFRLNLDHKPQDWLKFTLSTNYIYSSSDRGFFNNDNTGTTIGIALTATRPWDNLFPDANGIYPDHPNNSSNPLQTRDLVRNNETVNRFIMGGTVNLDIYKADNSNLELILRGGMDMYAQKTRAIFPKELQFQKLTNGGLNGVSSQGDTQNKNYNLSGFLVHNYFTDNDINFRTQAGLTNEFFDRNTVLVTATGLVASETNVDQAANTGVNQTRVQQEDSGFFVQEEVNFQDMLIATIGVRGDKSSNNGDANKLSYYPKGSLAVNINEFGFWKEDGAWDQFKLRAAYGEAGNFPPPGALFTSYNAFSTGGILGISLIGVRGDKSIVSERQKELEFGTDLSFLDGRAGLTATYYIKTIDDLILQSALEPSTGYTSEFVNAGALENKGIELSLDLVPVRTENFEWNLGINWFKNTSEITRLDVEPFNIGAFGAGLGTFRIEEGSSATQIVGSFAGELRVVGDAEPDFQMGINNNLRYKNLDLTFLWQWKKGGDNVNLTTLLTDLNRTSHDYDDITVDPDGLVVNGQYRPGAAADVHTQDASYLRLRELGLYYTIPKAMLSGVIGGTFDSIRLGFSGSNIINIFDYNSYDPEVSNFGGGTIFSGVEVTPFPSSKRYLFHVAANF
ncbi:SusC/RagA family TonB-linked outer membrane protein [Ulvibacter antarcticus]|uniref:TonB-linked SusC/RagA family outer membrane protein n=1 Tax=Ulvibacter antarcticus TaxID=442714 RepID=A0A3L9Z2A4_9FLAO|nr:SusC/RagA family TonB-linked outer membrane protein [Ulvibacter antarcticus]RMA66260.1 TonB-linked SusC/RagA family outer membrane protein [Ulvibacter antarcticus]